MAFGDFDLRTAVERFGLQLDERRDLFSGVAPVAAPGPLRALLDVWAPAAVAMNTEKARSEMIIAPILMAVVQLAPPPVRLFSGVTFDVDRERGLTGGCDYLISRSEEQFFVNRPVVAVVEAKREDVAGGLGQCVAEMVAVRVFNEREQHANLPVHGAVTTGSIWRFLRLEESTVFIDRPEYYLHQLERILGILVHLVGPPA